MASRTKTTLHTMMGNYANTKSLKDGKIHSDLVELDFAEVKVANNFFKSIVRDAKFDLHDLKELLEEFLEQFGLRAVTWTSRAEAAPLFLESALVQIGGKLTLGEAGLPKLTSGQHVRLFFDAFPYQRYGIVNATLDWVSPSGVSSPQGQHFIGFASLDKTELAKPHPLALRVGMGGEARIVIGQRTMIEYAFEPIRQLRENMRN